MKRIGVIMHGITGRMGYNQHLVRSVLAIRDQGGVLLKNGERVMLDPILVGRNGAKIEEIAKSTMSRAGRPTSTLPSQTPMTHCSSMPARRRCAAACWRKPSRPARTSIAKTHF